MLPLILSLVVVSQVPDPFVPSPLPSAPRGELAAPEGPAFAGPDLAVDSGGPSVPYPPNDVRAELLSPDFGPTLVRFMMRNGLVVVAMGAVAFGVLGGYVARAKGRASGEGVAIGALFGPIGVVVVGLLPESRKGV